MNTGKVEQDQLIERYILGKMGEEEASEFEAFFLSNQECLDELEAAEKLYSGLKLMSEDLDKQSNVTQINIEKRWWNFQVPAWAMAALLVLALMPSGLLFQLQHQDFPQPEVTRTLVDLSVSRALEEPEVIVDNTRLNTLTVFIDIELEGMLHSNYLLKVRNADNSELALEKKNQKLNVNYELDLNLGAGALKPGKYELIVYGYEDQQTVKELGRRSLVVNN